jgi:hypothetical protein
MIKNTATQLPEQIVNQLSMLELQSLADKILPITGNIPIKIS